MIELIGRGRMGLMLAMLALGWILTPVVVSAEGVNETGAGNRSS